MATPVRLLAYNDSTNQLVATDINNVAHDISDMYWTDTITNPDVATNPLLAGPTYRAGSINSGSAPPVASTAQFQASGSMLLNVGTTNQTKPIPDNTLGTFFFTAPSLGFAIRAGRLLDSDRGQAWNTANIGLASMAIGTNNQSGGTNSLTLGLANIQTGNNGLMLGQENTNVGVNSVMSGNNNVSTVANNSLVSGTNNIILNQLTDNSIVVGNNNSASGISNIMTDTIVAGRNNILGFTDDSLIVGNSINNQGPLGTSTSNSILSGSSQSVVDTDGILVTGNNNIVTSTLASFVTGNNNRLLPSAPLLVLSAAQALGSNLINTSNVSTAFGSNGSLPPAIDGVLGPLSNQLAGFDGLNPPVTGTRSGAYFRFVSTGAGVGDMGQLYVNQVFTTGADVAHMYEIQEGSGYDRESLLGCFVTLVNNRVTISTNLEATRGVATQTPANIMNSPDIWPDAQIKDAFGRYLTEPDYTKVANSMRNDYQNILRRQNPNTSELAYPDSFVSDRVELDNYLASIGDTRDPTSYINSIAQRKIINPDYDPTQVYIPRYNRPEWACVTDIGIVPVISDDPTITVDDYVVPNNLGHAIKSSNETGFQVIEVDNRGTIKIRYDPVTRVEAEIQDLTIRSEENQTNYSNLELRISQNETDIDNLETRLDQAETNIVNLDTRVTQNTTNITQNTIDIANLDTRTGQNETNIVNLDTRVTQNTTDIANLDTRTGQNETNIVNLDTRVTQNTTNITQNTNDISNLDTRVTQNTTNITQNTNDISNLDTRVDNLENRTDTIENNYTLLNLDLTNLSDLVNVQIGRIDLLNNVTLVDLRADLDLVTSIVNNDLVPLTVQFPALQTLVNTINTNVESIAARITNAELQLGLDAELLTSLDTRTSALETLVATLVTRITNNENLITTIQTSLTSLTNQVNTIAGQVTGLLNSIATINGQITALNTTLGNVQTAVTNNTNSINTITGQLATITTQLTTNTNAIAALTISVNNILGGLPLL